MDIKELNKIVKTGDVIVTRTDFKWNSPLSYLSFLIQKIGRVKYNHAKIVIFNWGVPMANEALGAGITSHLLGSRMRGKKIKILRPKFKFNEKWIAMRANSALYEVKYDFIGLLHQAVYLTTGKWIGKSKKSANKRMYCFEYVGWVYREIFPKWYKITPAEINSSDEFETVFEGKVT